MWSELLDESSGRVKAGNATVLCVGDPKSGKRSLVESFCVDCEARAPHEVLRYDYMNAHDPNDGPGEEESSSRVNVWSADEETIKYVTRANLLAPSSSSDALLILICVDVSRTKMCEVELRRWLSYAERCRSAWRAGLKDDTGASAMHQNCPVVVAATKTDTLAASKDMSSLKAATALQGKLRALCLATGASLVYTAAQTGANCVALHRLMLHLLSPHTFPMELAIDAQKQTLLIPAGLDSIDMVEAETDIPADLPALRTELAALPAFETRAGTGTDTGQEHAQAGVGSVEEGGAADAADSAGAEEAKALQNEQEWLQGLHAFISTAVAEGSSAVAAGTSGTPPATSTVTDSTDAAPVATRASARTKHATDGTAVGAAPAARATRSRLKVSTQGKDSQEAADFFKNLMAGGKK